MRQSATTARLARLLLITAVALSCLGCGRRATARTVRQAERRAPGRSFTPAVETLGRCSEHDPLRRAYFGDLHVHSTLSLDANIQGNRVSPSMAYRFARGERVGIQPHDEAGRPLRHARLERPLDFAAVTDHAEFLGVIAVCGDPTSPGYDRRGCEVYRDYTGSAFLWINSYLAQNPRRLDYPQFCGDDAEDCLEGEASLWSNIQNAAEAYYDRSADCRFTTFVGYEWTASPALSFRRVVNLHRNVIFRNNIVPALPAGYLRAHTPEALYDALEHDCIDKGEGCDALIVPHNANLSNGNMFLRWAERRWLHVEEFTPESAARRALFEPLQEIIQHKGASECTAFGFGSDEACGFESIPYRDLAHAKRDSREAPRARDTLRHGLAEGLRLARELGENPFAYGFIGSTDTHLGLPGAVDEFAFLGGGGAGESGAEGLPDRLFFSGGGLAGVWAEENSREGIFQALRRREVFATSGTRLRVRAFMGDDIPDDFCERPDRVEVGYRHGVPMGGRLETSARAPALAVMAQADLGTPEHAGARLQMLEVVRGRLEPDGSVSIEVLPVAGDADAGAGRDPHQGCEPSEEGAVELCALWRDPDFRPDAPSFYYVRAFETPTCRWSTRQCLAEELNCEAPGTPRELSCCAPVAGLHPPECASVDCRGRVDAGCCPEFRVQPMIRERAWTSPIFAGEY